MQPINVHVGGTEGVRGDANVVAESLSERVIVIGSCPPLLLWGQAGALTVKRPKSATVSFLIVLIATASVLSMADTDHQHKQH